jgi:nitrile hydratase accessory protein
MSDGSNAQAGDRMLAKPVAPDAGPGSTPDPAPVFAEPWQAQAFAMTLQLHQRGLFSWPEWAAALSVRVAAAQCEPLPSADAADAYWRQWLAALEDIVAAKGAADAPSLARCAQAWDKAADRTPHGQPIVLRPGDFGP